MEHILVAALRRAGLANETMTLIAENALLAKALVPVIQDHCQRFDRMISNTRHTAARGPVSSVSPADIIAAVDALRSRGERVSQAKVCIAIGKRPSYQGTLCRSPDLRLAYDKAVNEIP